MRKRVGLLAGLLVVVMGSGVVAQEPSPEPPPWFGGRVEMPEHGFAVTLPDGWFAMDMTTELDGQLDTVMEVGSLGEWFWGDSQGIRDRMALTPLMTPLWIVDESSGDSCTVSRDSMPVPAEDSEFAADFLHAIYLDEPSLADVEPPTTMDLPGGPVLKSKFSIPQVAPSSTHRATNYNMMTVEGVLSLTCLTFDTRPDDDWLSIAETIEFLPAEE